MSAPGRPKRESLPLGGTVRSAKGFPASRFVIAAFRPKPGMQQQLLDVVEKHWRVLRSQDLVTDRPRHAMQASDGSVIEVFEWRSAEAIEQAHHDPAVLALWAEFDAVCEYIPISALPEAEHPFSEFRALPI